MTLAQFHMHQMRWEVLNMMTDYRLKYPTRKFEQIWPELSDFTKDYNEFNVDIFDNSIQQTTLNTLYCLLFARYADWPIASRNEYQFKTQIFSTIFMYGPTWEKRLEIQKAVRELYKDGVLSNDLLKGGKAVYNTALNPSQPVAANKGATTGEGMNTLEELTYINQQNTTNYQKSLPEAYAILNQLLETDVTKEFIDKFKKFFWYGVAVGETTEYYYNPEDIR